MSSLDKGKSVFWGAKPLSGRSVPLTGKTAPGAHSSRRQACLLPSSEAVFLFYSMNRPGRLFLHSEQFPQDPSEHFGRFPNHNIHLHASIHIVSGQDRAASYLRQQAQPQAISKNATRNSIAPTGKIAVIKIPVPSAAAQTPSRRHPPPRFPQCMRHASFPLIQYIRMGLSLVPPLIRQAVSSLPGCFFPETMI